MNTEKSTHQPKQKVIIIGIDGGTWSIVDPLIEKGQLPAFQYLKEHGALDYVDAFDPNGPNVDRANKFLNRFRKTLTLTGDIHLLEEQVRRKYDLEIN